MMARNRHVSIHGPDTEAQDQSRQWGIEAIVGDGPPRGRELEIADLLSFIKHAGIHNTVWLTADVPLHVSPLLRPEQGCLSGFRAILGICFRSASRRQFRTKQA